MRSICFSSSFTLASRSYFRCPIWRDRSLGRPFAFDCVSDIASCDTSRCSRAMSSACCCALCISRSPRAPCSCSSRRCASRNWPSAALAWPALLGSPDDAARRIASAACRICCAACARSGRLRSRDRRSSCRAASSACSASARWLDPPPWPPWPASACCR